MTDPDPPAALAVDDEVLIRARVVQVVRGVGALVELFSKTDQYQAWIRGDLIAEVIPAPVPPEEPPDGTWLLGRADYDGTSSVFHRDDAEGHCDPKDAPEHWWDVAGQQWVSWPDAVRRGADPDGRLVAVAAVARAEVDALDTAGAIVASAFTALRGRHGRGGRFGEGTDARLFYDDASARLDALTNTKRQPATNPEGTP